MKPNWNEKRTKEELHIPIEYKKHDAKMQNRREFTFILQEAVFQERIPLFHILDVSRMAEDELKYIPSLTFQKYLRDSISENFKVESIVMVGFPIKEPMMLMEQQIPTNKVNRITSAAELKATNEQLSVCEKLEILGYHAQAVPFSIMPNPAYARLLSLSQKGIAGKNGYFITKDFGCKVAISIVVTDAPLMGDDYRSADFTEDVCINCNLCVENCPAGALSENGYNSIKCKRYRSKEENSVRLASHSVMRCQKCMEICPKNSYNIP